MSAPGRNWKGGEKDWLLTKCKLSKKDKIEYILRLYIKKLYIHMYVYIYKRSITPPFLLSH